ncbi:MAG: right-handed parallel beta-helix repeat-containing protein [Candidatus Thermoplasmatota archaeon]|nr:right-handed parallel beta-helix repeat-containing protein [Candidatus Thermoplasmatota archaeon]
MSRIFTLMVISFLALGVVSTSQASLSTPEQATVISPRSTEEVESDYQSHGSIRIDSNEDFAAQAEQENWPGNGTAEDPYMIEGYEIDSKGSGYCIYIGNTTVNFEIKDNYLHGASGNDGRFFRNSGVYLRNVKNGLVTNNTAVNNEYYGIYLLGSQNIAVINNTARKNDMGVALEEYSKENTVADNTASENGYHGILLMGSSDNNVIKNNIVSNNTRAGVRIEGSNDNLIYHNRLLENGNQAYDDGNNSWDDGDPAEGGGGGNYWSDYKGNNRGDGIGDDPYRVEGDGNQDDYPWVNIRMIHPAGSFNISVKDIPVGESPIIEISDGYDVHDNLLNGDYSVEVVVNNRTERKELTFSQGDSKYVGKEMNETGEYTAKVTIDGVTGYDTFSVGVETQGRIEIEPEGKTVHAGQKVSYTATEYDENGSEVGNVTEETEWSIEDGAGGSWDQSRGFYTSENVGEWKVTGTYEELTDNETLTVVPSDYNLTISIQGEGSTDPSEGIHAYEDGTEVDVTAIPDEGWYFAGWTGNITSGEGEITVKMDSHKNLTANFQKEGVEYFDVKIISWDEEAGKEDKLTVTYRVKNMGKEKGTQDIAFYVDGKKIDRRKDVAIPAGENRTDHFTWEFEEGREYEIEVASNDTTDSEMVTVDGTSSLDEESPILGILSHYWWLVLLVVIVALAGMVFVITRGKGDSEGKKPEQPPAQKKQYQDFPTSESFEEEKGERSDSSKYDF